jgi:hypothetical protein
VVLPLALEEELAEVRHQEFWEFLKLQRILGVLLVVMGAEHRLHQEEREPVPVLMLAVPEDRLYRRKEAAEVVVRPSTERVAPVVMGLSSDLLQPRQPMALVVVAQEDSPEAMVRAAMEELGTVSFSGSGHKCRQRSFRSSRSAGPSTFPSM